MTNSKTPVLMRNAELTPKADKKGVEIFVCAPPWFDEQEKFKISNAPPRTAGLDIDGSDLNFMVRVLYAEASGSSQLTDKTEREKEKSAIMNVNHFRLNRRGYPKNSYVAKNFRMVCQAPEQYESVFANKDKFSLSEKSISERLTKSECGDLCEAIRAVLAFIKEGPRSDYQFDNFRGYNQRGFGQHIGRSRFWLSNGGAKLLAKTP